MTAASPINGADREIDAATDPTIGVSATTSSPSSTLSRRISTALVAEANRGAMAAKIAIPPGQRRPAGPPAHQPDDHRRAERPLRPEPDRRLLRLQGVPPRGAGEAAASPRRAGACRCSCGCRRPGSGCASRRSACRGSTSTRTGPSAACSTTPSERLAYYRRSSPRPSAQPAAAHAGALRPFAVVRGACR